jgi:hypothetical protein
MEIVFSVLTSCHLTLLHERGPSLMGSSDSKLEKQIDEELPLTERYYGFHNVRLRSRLEISLFLPSMTLNTFQFGKFH